MCSKVYSAVYVACVDDGIGKFDRSMLSQQDLMELFIFGLNEPEKICGNRDDPADVCGWEGVKCNANGEVEVFKWNNKQQALTRRKDTSPWWVGPVPQFWGKPRTFSNPLSCFCHGADPIDGHRKVVGQDQYPALGEVRETAKLLPRGQSLWWRDEGRHLLILCCFQSAG